ncbi:MAG: nucleoside-diphosphate sugar epimerase, partial [Gammaproteobacteria bacterium]|nr:nucleoside-diphosphate sugar epimerase [Gammaproteobacteria bacterium]
STRNILATLNHSNISYQPYHDAKPGWIENQLAASATAWVTQDSISMIFEALTCGAAVGILSVPVRRTGRVVKAIHTLTERGEVLVFDDWKNGTALRRTTPPFNEAERCAQLILENFGLL